MKFRPAVFSNCILLLLLATPSVNSTHAFSGFLTKTYSISSSNLDNRISADKNEFSLLQNESIGNLKIGLSEEKVRQIISNCALKREPEQLWGADGAYHQKWKYVNCGITLSVVSEQKGGKKSIESISLNSPSRLSTKRGIRIGSAESAVMKAYKVEWDKESSKSGYFVAGSIYGGLIFQFKNSKVSQIFLGAAAE
jgi:hypothetical protein